MHSRAANRPPAALTWLAASFFAAVPAIAHAQEQPATDSGGQVADAEAESPDIIPAPGQARDNSDVTPAAKDPRTISKATQGWRLHIPDGWHLIRPEVLESVNEMVRDAGQASAPSFSHGLTTDPDGDLTYPYILIHAIEVDLRAATYEDVQQVIDSGYIQSGVRQTQKEIDGVAGALPSAPTLDRENARASFELDMNVDGVGPVHGYMTMYFTRDRIIQFNGYALEQDAAQDKPRIEAVAANFTFDPGSKFTPANMSQREIRTYTKYGIIGASLAAIIIAPLARRFFMRQSA
jgi:hypothetical protein